MRYSVGCMADRGHDDRDWIDTAVKVAEWLGFSGMRVRWQLMRLRKSLERSQRDAVNQTQHLSYEHAVCPHCGRVQDRSNDTCSRCGARLGARPFQMLQRIGLVMPRFLSMSTLLGVMILAAYFRIMTARPGTGIFDVPGDLLVAHGAYFLPAIEQGQWWRHGTAVFLHIGLWHLAFNLIALAQVGPGIEEIFGRGRMIFLFMLTGVLANVACQLWGLQAISAGASGAIMGLIGAAAGWGQRDGTSQGRAVRNHMLKWAAYTMLFGFMVNANNIAHGAGFVAGGLFGYFTPPSWTRRNVPLVADLATGLLGLCAAIACTWLVIRPPASAASQARALAEDDGERVDGVDRDAWFDELAKMAEGCDLERAGERKRALEIFRAAHPATPGFDEGDARQWCEVIAGLREQCRSLDEVKRQPPDGSPEESASERGDLDEQLLEMCARIGKRPSADAAAD